MTFNSKSLRIVGGVWSSRKINFTATQIRPTSDMLRETLFNWLMPYIQGAYCLDMFAGSGVLGIEALSRQAAQVTFIDSCNQAINSINNNLNNLLDKDQEKPYRLIRRNALSWLKTATSRFDIVFLDPPFNSQFLQTSADLLDQYALLGKDSVIYIEYPRQQIFNPPDNWQILKQKKSGNLIYALYQKNDS
jgi:16S rRNA (guanine966-N2)-methyltransferase